MLRQFFLFNPTRPLVNIDHLIITNTFNLSSDLKKKITCVKRPLAFIEDP
jgi:hypothetical protein